MSTEWKASASAENVYEGRDCATGESQVDRPVFQASLLMREYLELLILHHLGYQGTWRRMYPEGRWAALGVASGASSKCLEALSDLWPSIVGGEER